MARTKHTDPSRLRAARRLGAPRDSRGEGDLAARRRQGLARQPATARPEKVPKAAARQPDTPRPGPLLRVTARRLPPGFIHPASRSDVAALLESIGPLAIYGLRAVELAAPAAGPSAAGALRFGYYQAPGRIVLLAQPLPPWRFPGRLPAAARRRLEEAGAAVSELAGGAATAVDWPPGALRRFLLEEVLLHELGHHVLQRDKGKRPARIARTADHEASARRFALRWRKTLASRSATSAAPTEPAEPTEPAAPNGSAGPAEPTELATPAKPGRR